jgi:hypothetical protein
VDEFGFTAFASDAGDYASFGAVLRNPNTEWAVYRMLIQINLFDANDTFVGGPEIGVTVLPGQTTGVSGLVFGAGSAARMLVAIPEDPTPYVPLVSGGTIEVSGVSLSMIESGALISGTLTSSLTSDQTFLQLFAVYRDSASSIVGGTSGAVESISAGASIPFEILDNQPPNSMATADVYWQLGGALP